MIAALVRRAGFAFIESELRRAFRRIVWAGPVRLPDPAVPVVVYANHHLFHDALALGWLLERRLGRRPMVWMEEASAFPYLRALGALPFPADDAGRRVRTVRETARAFARPGAALIYFPEGRLHDAAGGVLPFSPDRFARLDRVLPAPKQWWPVTLHVTGSHEHRPTLRVATGLPTRAPDRDPVGTLAGLLDLARREPAAGRELLAGRPGPHERWRVARARGAA